MASILASAHTMKFSGSSMQDLCNKFLFVFSKKVHNFKTNFCPHQIQVLLIYGWNLVYEEVEPVSPWLLFLVGKVSHCKYKTLTLPKLGDKKPCRSWLSELHWQFKSKLYGLLFRCLFLSRNSIQMQFLGWTLTAYCITLWVWERDLAPKVSSTTSTQLQRRRATSSNPTKCKEQSWNISNAAQTSHKYQPFHHWPMSN